MGSQLGCWGSAHTELWKPWTTLGGMAVDRQGASLQSWWLHSCWWSCWWTQRSSCLCGRCCPRARPRPVLWLLHSGDKGNTEKTHQREACQSTSDAEPLTDVPLHLCSLSILAGFVLDRAWTCSCSAALAPVPYPAVPNKAQKFPLLCTDSCPLFSQLCPGCFWIDLWMLFHKLKEDCFMNLYFNFMTWLWWSARFGSLNYTLLPQKNYSRDQEAWDPSAAPGNTEWMWTGTSVAPCLRAKLLFNREYLGAGALVPRIFCPTGAHTATEGSADSDAVWCFRGSVTQTRGMRTSSNTVEQQIW